MKKLFLILSLSFFFLSNAGYAQEAPKSKETESSSNYSTAIFAAGCFWCIEKDFEKLKGVYGAESGYIGGSKTNPTYKEVSKGTTGHVEAVRVSYDPEKISYKKLLDHFWINVDPLNGKGQFCDNGFQYTSAVFWKTEEERLAAEKSKVAVAKKLKAKVATRIVEETTFYLAEKYHQDYYKKNPLRYKYYRYSCGRDKRLEQLWGER